MDKIKGFYGNLVSYVVVNIGLLVLYLVTSPDHLWFYWPLLGWGLRVLIHGMKVFDYVPFLDNDWEEKKIREFMQKEVGNQKRVDF